MSDHDEQPVEPDEDDGFIFDIASGYSAKLAGRHLGNFAERADAEQAIREDAGGNFWPDVWFVSDHGNALLLDFDWQASTDLPG